MNWVTLPLPAVFLDAGLLLLRICLGLSVFLIHGFSKVQDFGGTLVMFRDNMGIAPLFGTGAILAESLCALLLAIGLATRWAAGLLALTMAVAFFVVHQATLAFGNPNSGELAFTYLAGYLALVLAGPGRFSVDAKLAPALVSDRAAL